MSSNDIIEVEEVVVDMKCCASCGIAEVDDVKLKPCDGCDLVKYCSDACKANHRLQHETSCKERATELRDEILFRQPESTHLGDCPICCLPIQVEGRKYVFTDCCFKMICLGCTYTTMTCRGMGEQQIEETTCPFCREQLGRTEEEQVKTKLERFEANDPFIVFSVADMHYRHGEYDDAFECFSKAAELGDVEAHYKLSEMYSEGHGVEKNEKKEIYHVEEAAIKGHPNARAFLAGYEENKGRNDRAVKHWIIAANLGDDDSMKKLKESYKCGFVSKEDFAAALRGHHAVVKATKSPQRDEADAIHKMMIAEETAVQK